MPRIISLLLLFFVSLEAYCQVLGVHCWNLRAASLFYFLSGIFIAIRPLIKRDFLSLKKENFKNKPHKTPQLAHLP